LKTSFIERADDFTFQLGQWHEKGCREAICLAFVSVGGVGDIALSILEALADALVHNQVAELVCAGEPTTPFVVEHLFVDQDFRAFDECGSQDAITEMTEVSVSKLDPKRPLNPLLDRYRQRERFETELATASLKR
jgi:hypothetical protein